MNYGAQYFATWLGRAWDFTQAALAGNVCARFQEIVAHYPQVVAHLAGLPRTFVHGELYAVNVLVDTSSQPVRVRAIDWEMAGIGPALLDLAALVTGRWSADQQQSLADAYYRASGLERAGYPRESFSIGLRTCRLHLAMQWLGWSRDWSAAPDQAHDWLAEALTLADELGL